MVGAFGSGSELAYAAGWRLVRILPERIAVMLFNAGADIAAATGKGTHQLRKNYARVLDVKPEDVPHTLLREGLRSYARYWRETFRLPSMDLTLIGEELDDLVEGQHHLDHALAQGKGAVLALPHSGNFDMAGVWLVRHCGQFSTVAERLKPESLFNRFVEYRESLGFEVFALNGGQSAPFAALADKLRAGGVVCLLGERDLTDRGVRVEFFGEPTRMPAGAAKLAMETGAVLLTVHCWFTRNGGWGFRIDPPVDTAEGIDTATQSIAHRFAANIAEHPQDWHVLQPLWWSDLSEARQARLGQP
ncbi:phosphatidylinositol mannoside acyltransferase [Rhodococcus sp. SRB_17]|nr:phosphatidylinositol mannoside acyltransferase [Rhodococcus sp. SRB_17]